MITNNYKEFVCSIVYEKDGTYKAPSPYDDLPAKIAMVGDFMGKLHDDREWKLIQDCMDWIRDAKVTLNMISRPE